MSEGGGSYERQADGSLKLVQRTLSAEEAKAAEEAKKKTAKTDPKKETDNG